MISEGYWKNRDAACNGGNDDKAQYYEVPEVEKKAPKVNFEYRAEIFFTE